MANKFKTSTWLRFTTLGIQMGLIIYFGSMLGIWLDENHPSDFFNYRKIITLFAVLSALLSLIYQVIKMSNDEKT